MECIDCGEKEGFLHYKIFLSKQFKKEYGRKGVDCGPFCLACLTDYLDGSKMGFYQEYIIKIKLIKIRRAD